MQNFEQLNNLSDLSTTWIFDLAGTIVYHKPSSVFSLLFRDTLLPGVREFFKTNIKEGDYVLFVTARNRGKLATRFFLWKNGIRYNKILFNLPYGERILFNDIKPLTNLKTAYAINLVRNKGFEIFKEK